VRWSEQTTYDTCPFKYKLLFIDKLRKLTDGRESNDRVWGQAIHAALKTYYNPGGDVLAAKKAFLKVYPRDLNPTDKVKSVASGMATLENYHVNYADQDTNWKVLATEVEGSIEIACIDCDGKGCVKDDSCGCKCHSDEHGLHIDLIAENLQAGGIYFWDHKTSYKRPSPGMWDHYNLSSQLTRYSAYVEKEYGQCSGAYINSITVGYRSRVYKGQPPGYWNHFERQLFNRTPDQIAFWKASDRDWMRLIEFSKKEDCWPKLLDKLCSWCEFNELCKTNDDPEIRKALYEVEMGPVVVDG